MKPQTNQRCRCARLSLPDRAARAVLGIIAALVSVAPCRLGAATGPAALASDGFQPRLNISVYQPVTSRDPFLTPGARASPAKSTTTDATMFRIDGVFGSPKKMTAIVNGAALSLNKPVVIDTASGRIQVKAVQITFEGVVLEVGGQRVEVKRAADKLPKPQS